MQNLEFEIELKNLLVTELQLEDVEANGIDSEDRLFGEGLWLDSIDALELAVAIERKYGVKIQPDDADQRKVFASVRTLANFLLEQRA